jgi:ELWxxDGT repeat protein
MAANVAFFSGRDTHNHLGLWVTDGTAAGTFEVGGLDDAGVSGVAAAGLQPGQIWTANHVAYFAGTDSAAGTGLWVSDGTANGTFEIGGLDNQGVAGAWHLGLGPSVPIGYRGKVLFNGLDSGGNDALWITDGTAAGTKELGGLDNQGVSGASPGGLNPSTVIAFNGKIYFAGNDTSNGGSGVGLWATDGTAAGTMEIGGPADAGVAGAASGGFNPFVMVVASGQLFFRGSDSSGGTGLWVSDGTGSGTVEIGGLKNQGVSNSGSLGLQPGEFAQLNGNVFFNGSDSAGGSGLWTSDGTVAGTVEIGGLQDQGIADVGVNGLNPFNLTRIGNKVVFGARNAANNAGLWITDGTAAGTFEIGGINNQGIAGAPATGLVMSPVTTFNGKLLFSAVDSGGHSSLWQSDGTAAGTVEIATATNSQLTIASPPAPPLANDFNGDNLSDILWRSASGGLADWSMNSGVIASSGLVKAGGAVVNPDATWSVAGFGDFNGDGVADVLWRNTSGELTAWLMNGSTIAASADLTSNGVAVRPDATWSVVGTGDFNGDGKADILWRNSTSGEVTEWLMNGATVVSGGDVTSNGVAVAPDATWSVAGIGDFNADGQKDILWRKTDGTLAAWDMNGAAIASSGVLTSGGVAVKPDATWSIAGIGDFNGDQSADILWRNSNGTLAIWLMNNTTITSGGAITSNGVAVSPDASWHVVQIGDFNGDGNSDILWRNDNGGVAEWIMSGNTIMKSLTPASNGTAVSPDATWTPQAKPTFG